jgi:hypothetical protein
MPAKKTIATLDQVADVIEAKSRSTGSSGKSFIDTEMMAGVGIDMEEYPEPGRSRDEPINAQEIPDASIEGADAFLVQVYAISNDPFFDPSRTG